MNNSLITTENNVLPQVINSYPPNIDLIRKHLNVPEEGIVFTYNGKIYSPHAKELPQHLLLHEMVHVKQQGNDSDSWWNRYLTDIEFRLEQELEAYTEQYLFLKMVNKTSTSHEWLFILSEQLSHPVYGFNLTRPQAETKLRIRAKHFFDVKKETT